LALADMFLFSLDFVVGQSNVAEFVRIRTYLNRIVTNSATCGRTGNAPYHYGAIICKCSTIGPRASAGTKFRAPTSSTVPIRKPTKRGVCVGSVPDPGGVYFLAANEPAMASVGIMSQ